jgi:hypothetical protein
MLNFYALINSILEQIIVRCGTWNIPSKPASRTTQMHIKGTKPKEGKHPANSSYSVYTL